MHVPIQAGGVLSFLSQELVVQVLILQHFYGWMPSCVLFARCVVRECTPKCATVELQRCQFDSECFVRDITCAHAGLHIPCKLSRFSFPTQSKQQSRFQPTWNSQSQETPSTGEFFDLIMYTYTVYVLQLHRCTQLSSRTIV